MTIETVKAATPGRTKIFVLATEKTHEGTPEQKIFEIESGKHADLQEVANRPGLLEIHAIYRGKKMEFKEKRKVSFR